MLKKSLIVGGAVALLLALFFGRDCCSYLGTTAGWVKESVKDSVPIQFELERARNMIANLDPEIRRNMHLIAKEEAEVERLASQINGEQDRLGQAESDILRLNEDLKTNKGSFYYGGRNYSVQQVKADLSNRFDRFKVNKATLEKLEQILTARNSKLDAARQKLAAMRAAKQQLEVEVENLEAQQKMVEVAQTVSEFNFDDSQLSRTRKLIDEIRTRIEVAGKMVDADTSFPAEIPLNEPAETKDITDAVTEYFTHGHAHGAYAGSK
jgi:DNA repair exonuclease SbcCD ATPase subunit